MTSPYITPAVREDAEKLVSLLRGKTMTRNEINLHFDRNKSALDRAFSLAKNRGQIDFTRVKGICYWGHCKRIEEIRKEAAQLEAERERIRKAKAREDFDPDSVPDMPVVRRIIPAAMAKPVATNAARWVFEAAA